LAIPRAVFFCASKSTTFVLRGQAYAIGASMVQSVQDLLAKRFIAHWSTLMIIPEIAIWTLGNWESSKRAFDVIAITALTAMHARAEILLLTGSNELALCFVSARYCLP
jgi:hypothetical protein